MIHLDSAETNTVKELVKRYGEDITLGQLLKAEYTQPIQEVTFKLEGIYDNAYECTGDSFSRYGKIEDYFANEFGSPLETDKTGVPLSTVVSDSELNELANYFLGERDEYYQIYTKAVQSREVTHEEIVEYLKTLYVNKSFAYDDTVTEF